MCPRLLIVLAAILSLATAARALDVYINDDGNGTTGVDCSTGYTTWANAIAAHVPAAGDHYKFCTGTYRETVTLLQNGTSGNPIVLERATGSDVPVITGTDRCTSWTNEGSGVYSCAFTPTMGTGCTNGVQKLFVDGAPIAEAQANGCPSPVTTLATVGYCSNWPRTDCTIDANCAGQPDGTSGTCILSKWCWDSAAGGGPRVYVHLVGDADPVSHTIEVGSRQAVINTTNRSWYTVDGLTIHGGESWCTVREPWTMAAINAGAGVTITNNSWKYNGITALQITGPTSAVISNNLFEDGGPGWSYLPSSGAIPPALVRVQATATAFTFTGNTFRRLGTHHWSHPGSSIFVNNCGVTGGVNTGACYARALSVQSPNGLLHIDDNVGELIEDGFDLEPVTGAVFTAGGSMSRNRLQGWPHGTRDAFSSTIDNLGVRCTTAAGASTACATAGIIFHEFLIERNWLLGGFRVGMRINMGNKQPADAFTVRIANNIIKAGDATFGTTDSAAIYVEGSTDGIQLYNNTFQCERPSAGGGSGLRFNAGAGVDVRNNVFDFPSCTAKFTDSSSSDTWNASTNLCAAAVAGSCITGANSLTYVNESAVDLRLVAGDTVAIDLGETLTGFSDDIDGISRPQLTAWDIGASEYFSGADTPTPAPTSTRTNTPTRTATVTNTPVVPDTATSTATSTATATATNTAPTPTNTPAINVTCPDPIPGNPVLTDTYDGDALNARSCTTGIDWMRVHEIHAYIGAIAAGEDKARFSVYTLSGSTLTKISDNCDTASMGNLSVGWNVFPTTNPLGCLIPPFTEVWITANSNFGALTAGFGYASVVNGGKYQAPIDFPELSTTWDSNPSNTQFAFYLAMSQADGCRARPTPNGITEADVGFCLYGCSQHTNCQPLVNGTPIGTPVPRPAWTPDATPDCYRLPVSSAPSDSVSVQCCHGGSTVAGCNLRGVTLR